MITKLLIVPFYFIFLITLQAQITPADIDKIVADEMIRQNLPGLAIGVYQNSTINYLKGYGYIDIDGEKHITTDTPFRWASISKTLTAIAAFQLDERRNDFSVDDKVSNHYNHWTSNFNNHWTSNFIGKEVPDKLRKESITIKHLLNHKSGIQHYGRGLKKIANEYKYKSSSTYESDSDNFNADSAIDIFKEADLDFNPGSNYLYTTFGYNLLGAVIDKKTGSYTHWIENNIKNILGMPSLKVANGDFYGFRKPRDGIIIQGKDSNKEYVLPGGGWESNIKDLLKFAIGINRGQLLSNTERLWRTNGIKDYNGLESKISGGKLSVWHGGAHGNLRTLMYLMPNQDIAVVVMIPAQYANTVNIVNSIINKMGITKIYATSPVDKCVSGMNSSTKKFIGVWRKTNTDVLLRNGYTTANFNREWNFLKNKGYQVFDIEAYNYKGNLVWDGVFKKASGGFGMFRNYNHKDFNKKWNQMNKEGFKLFDLETYSKQGHKKWAGLFKKEIGNNALWRNFSTKDFASKREEMAKEEKKLIDIEVSNSKGSLKWSGVWIAGQDGLLNRNYDLKNFENLIQTRADKGYKLIDIETYTVNGKRKWAGIWEKSLQIQHVSIGLKYCDFMKLHATYSDQNYELIDIERY